MGLIKPIFLVEMNTKDQIKKLGISGSLVIFVGAGILMHLQTKFVIPWLSRVTGMEIIIFWFVIGGLGIFLPLILLGMFLLKREGVWGEPGLWRERLRFRRMGRDEWVWSVVGVVAVSLLSGLVLKGMVLLVGQFDHSPPFMAFEPLEKGRYWLLLVWLPYWILNIFGEEFLWRGVMLPRQEAALGKYAWLFHGSGWGLFHIAFGWQLLVTLLPLIFIQSFVVHQTRTFCPGSPPGRPPNARLIIGIRFLSIQILVPPPL